MGRHKPLKLLSLLLAVALWFAVGGEERTETALHMSLELVNLPPQQVLVSEVAPGLQVRVMGPRSIITKLSQSRLSHTLDLSGYKSGRHSFSLGPNSFSFPRGVLVTRIQPNPLVLTLAATITRTLPIKPTLEGSPHEGYELLNATTRPEQVTVTGPAPELAGLKFIPTLPIDLSQITGPIMVATDLDFKNLHLSLKEQVPILADIAVGPKTLTRTFSAVPVAAAPKPARLQPPQVTLTLKGPWHQLKDLKPADLKPTVNTLNLSPGRHRLNVAVQLPPGLELVRTQPGAVMVIMGKSP